MLADKIVNSGGLLPDDIVNKMIKQEIINDTNTNGFIYDGFPRTATQAKMLDQFLNYRKTPITNVIHLDSPKHIVLQRILDRGKISGRKDDNAEVFKTRWSAYKTQTLPALKYFEGRGVVVDVDGIGEIDEVYERIKTVMDGL